jgi:hypothetical protein
LGTCSKHFAQTQTAQQIFGPSCRFVRIEKQLLDQVLATNATKPVGPESDALSSLFFVVKGSAFILCLAS